MTCRRCGHIAHDFVAWPAEAFWRLAFRGATLWAWNRDHLSFIREYIAATARRNDWTREPHVPGRVHKIPKTFVRAGNREKVLALIDRALTDE